MEISSIIKQMTIEQKISLLTGKDFWSTNCINELEVPSIYCADGPHGVRKQMAASDHLGLNKSTPSTCFPTSATLANSWNIELLNQIGVYLGKEAASMDVNVLLGPGVNIKRNPLCGRNFEYFSEDPFLTGKLASSYIRGVQENGISACVKHFAANNQEYRRMVIDSIVDERALHEIYLTPFEMAVKEGKTKSIMSSYNKLNGNFTNENYYLLVDILRNKWGYKGIVITDWAGCNDRVKGLICGNELEMPSCKYGIEDVKNALNNCYINKIDKNESLYNYEKINKYFKNGKLDESIIDISLERLLELAFSTDNTLKQSNKTFNTDEHHELAKQAALESIVLLKNNNDVLPIKKEKICFIGDFANKARFQGAGSSLVNPTIVETFKTEVMKYNVDYIGFSEGFKRYGQKSKALKKKAVNLASQSDIIVYFAGLDEVTEAEGLDRKNMKVPSNQLEVLKALYKLNKKVVVILFSGSPVEFDVIEDADAIIHAYLPGQAGVSAILDIITGKVCPSGKLAESYPYKYEDAPTSDTFGDNPMITTYKESIFVGYRYYEKVDKKVRYPFGYGLSYSKFDYSDINIKDGVVTFKVKNIGKYPAKEITQLYISKHDSKYYRPIKELKGFKKVHLNVGEEKEVSINLDEYSFRVYDIDKHDWIVESGCYDIMIGSSSAEIRLSIKYHIEGVECEKTLNNIAEIYYTGDPKNATNDDFETLIDRKIPSSNYDFYKKNRMVIHENCTVYDLRYSKGWTGKVFSGVIRFVRLFLWKIGAKTLSNTITMGVYHQPIRGIAKFASMSRNQLEGMILMFNGSFFRGLKKFFSKK